MDAVVRKVLEKIVKLKPRDKLLDKMIMSLKEEGFTGRSNGIFDF